MKLFTESDIFSNYLNKADSVQANIFKLLSNNSGAVIINDKIKAELDIMLKIHKENSTAQCIGAVNSMDILIVVIPAANNIPECIPFVKYKKGEKNKVIINVSRYVVEDVDRDTKEVEYKIDVQKLYSLLMPAFITLRLMDKSTIISPEIMKHSAILWARMFNKVLIKTIALTTNKERYEAFMYYAIRFFLKYYIEAPDVIVDSISESYLLAGKTTLINIIDTKVKDLNINMNQDFTTFCKTLFNNDISNIKGIRINNINENINVSFYTKKFIEMYNFSAIGALMYYPYFLEVIFSSSNWAGLVNDRSMEDIVQYDKKSVPKIINGLLKDI